MRSDGGRGLGTDRGLVGLTLLQREDPSSSPSAEGKKPVARKKLKIWKAYHHWSRPEASGEGMGVSGAWPWLGGDHAGCIVFSCQSFLWEWRGQGSGVIMKEGSIERGGAS